MVLDVKPDRNVLLFTLAASVLTGILFDLAPALRAARADLASAMKESAGSVSEGRRGYFLGTSLVVAQIAASLVLLIGAGLFVRTLGNFERKNLGFDQNNLLTFRLAPTQAGFSSGGLEDFYVRLLRRGGISPGSGAE